MNKKVLLILSRNYHESQSNGRKTIINNYLKCFPSDWDVESIDALSVLSGKGLFLRLQAVLAIVVCLLSFKPLQSAIFLNLQNLLLIRKSILATHYELVIIDSIRLFFVFRLLAPHKSVKYILDMDDLMSNRDRFYLDNFSEIELGEFGGRLRPMASRIPHFVYEKILKREVLVLEREEALASGYFHKIIFTSSEEMAGYLSKYPQSKGKLVSQIIPFEKKELKCGGRPGRLIYGFVGSDQVPQNKETIDFLLDFWRRHSVDADLYICGRQTRRYPCLPENIKFSGFVEDIGDFYGGLDAVIAPSFVPGGVKTKVYEAFSYGVPVIGNEITFSGIGVGGDYPYIVSESDLSALLGMREAEMKSNIDKFRKKIDVREYCRTRAELEAQLKGLAS